MYKAVFLDMDGTLLRSDHSVSEPTRETLRKLTGKGIPVILVSARPLDAMLPTAREIGLAGFLVSLNGSYIVESEKPVFQAIIDLPTTAEAGRRDPLASRRRSPIMSSGNGMPNAAMPGRSMNKRS